MALEFFLHVSDIEIKHVTDTCIRNMGSFSWQCSRDMCIVIVVDFILFFNSFCSPHLASEVVFIKMPS